MFAEVTAPLQRQPVLDRTCVNFWEDAAVIAQVNSTGLGRIVMLGLWTSVCIARPALSAIDQGFEVYVMTDACGDISDEQHERAIASMVRDR